MTVTAEERQAFLEFDATLGPEYRAELIAGRIVVNPPPAGSHEHVLSRLILQIARKSAVVADVSANRGLSTPYGNFIPDLTVAEEGSFDGEPPWGTPVGTFMLVGVTSSAPVDDRETKRQAYAAAAVPLYLLVDRGRRESVLLSNPDVEARDYRTDHHVPFGSDLEVPAPFSFTLTDFTPAGD